MNLKISQKSTLKTQDEKILNQRVMKQLKRGKTGKVYDQIASETSDLHKEETKKIKCYCGISHAILTVLSIQKTYEVLENFSAISCRNKFM